MKKTTLLFYSIAASFGLHAQSLSPVVIASAGGFSANSNNSMSYTVGEMTMVKTFSNGGNILTQGFQQPNETLTGLLDLETTDIGSFVVYPNPAVNDAWLGFQLTGTGKVTVSLYNAIGQNVATVYHGAYSGGKMVEPVHFSALAAGTYFLRMVFNSDKDQRDYTISKELQIIQ